MKSTKVGNMRTKTLFALMCVGAILLASAISLLTATGTTAACDDETEKSGVKFCLSYTETSSGYEVSCKITNNNSYAVCYNARIVITYPGGSFTWRFSNNFEGLDGGESESESSLKKFPAKPTKATYDIKVWKK